MKTQITPFALSLLVTIFAVPSSTLSQADVNSEKRATEELLLIVGEQRVFNAADIASFSESTRGIIEVKVPRDGRKMIVTAVRPGATSLLLIGRNAKERVFGITVFSQHPETIERGHLRGRR